MGTAIKIWQITDGTRGHQSQSTGLIEALSRRISIETTVISIEKDRASWWQAFFGGYAAAKKCPPPDLIVGAGSRTHATILAAKRATRSPAVVLMAPPVGLRRLFDLCIIPEHDQLEGPNIVQTKGALNLVRPAEKADPLSGLILIGGPSKHHSWDEEMIVQQVHRIAETEPWIKWKITNSRRTPESTTKLLASATLPNLSFLPCEKTEAAWLPRALSNAAQVWVTEDSVSMIYESLSSGAKVGILGVPRKSKSSRVIVGVDELLRSQMVLKYSDNTATLGAFPKNPPLAEADRVAEIIHTRFFS